MKIYRHGDVVIKEVEKLPRGLKKKADNIVAYGEATGHNHKLVELELGDLSVYQSKEGKIYFEATKPVQLKHQEHKTITIDPGSFIIEIERERDPFLEQIKQVVD